MFKKTWNSKKRPPRRNFQAAIITPEHSNFYLPCYELRNFKPWKCYGKLLRALNIFFVELKKSWGGPHVLVGTQTLQFHLVPTVGLPIDEFIPFWRRFRRLEWSWKPLECLWFDFCNQNWTLTCSLHQACQTRRIRVRGGKSFSVPRHFLTKDL